MPNTSLDILEKKRNEYHREIKFFEDPELSDVSIDSKTAEARLRSEETSSELIELVRNGINSLSPVIREVVRRYKLEGIPFTEVAEELGITPGAARVRAHRAYNGLRAKLEEPLREIGYLR